MWHVEKKLMSLYRSGLEPEINETQVDLFTSQISGILSREKLITRKPEFPFSIEKLEYFHENLKNKLKLLFIRKELVSILREKPGQYEYFLDGKQLEQDVISKISGYIEQYGEIARDQYSSFHGIRKTQEKHYMIHIIEHVNEMYKKTSNSLKQYEKLYTIIKKDKDVYKKLLKTKRERKRKQERVLKETAKSDDLDNEVVELQMSLEALGSL